MARKTLDVTITGAPDNRDAGKTFHLTEMSASQAERWASRAFRALARGKVDFPADIEGAGIAELAQFGLKALSGVDDDTFDGLMSEVMSCVQIRERAGIRSLTDDDIEEVSTRLKLRAEVFQLCTGFSLTAAKSRLAAVTAAKPVA